MNFLYILGVAVMSISPVFGKTFIRAAIDIGSGGVRLRVAEVDAAAGKIVRMIDEKRCPVNFYDDLSRNQNGRLEIETMDRGVQAVKAVIASVKSCNIDRFAIVGTSLFRNAINGKHFAERIQVETGVKVSIIDQDLEGGLGFLAAAAHCECSPQDLIVWDIGTSVQWSFKLPNECFHVAKSEEGSAYFRDYIINTIQRKILQEHRTPNPISQTEANLASAHAVLLGDKMDQIFKDKLLGPRVKVVGVGSIFGKGILPCVGGNPRMTIEVLDHAIENLIGKTDEVLGSGEFACVEVSNALLIQGFMRHLNLDSIDILDVNLADGAMIYEPFWE